MKRGDSYAIWMGRSSWNPAAFCSFRFTLATKNFMSCLMYGASAREACAGMR